MRATRPAKNRLHSTLTATIAIVTTTSSPTLLRTRSPPNATSTTSASQLTWCPPSTRAIKTSGRTSPLVKWSLTGFSRTSSKHQRRVCRPWDACPPQWVRILAFSRQRLFCLGANTAKRRVSQRRISATSNSTLSTYREETELESFWLLVHLMSSKEIENKIRRIL